MGRITFANMNPGDSPLYYLAVAIYGLPCSPRVDRQRGHVIELLHELAQGAARYDDLEFRRSLRSYQHAGLRMGKRAAR